MWMTLQSKLGGAGRRDAEKRWSDPKTTKRVVIHVAIVVAAAFIVLAAVAGTRNPVLAAAVPATLFAGGVAALVRGFVAYRRGSNWVHWEAGGWALFVLALVALSVPGAAYQQ